MAHETAAVKAPRQDRSRRTLARIVAAARELLAEEGADGVVVQGVVERAHATVGSFYARFSGKEDLLRHLEERVWADVKARWNASLADSAWPRAGLEGCLERVVDLLRVSLHVGEAERRGLAARAGGAERERDFDAHVRRTLRERVLDHEDEIRHPDAVLAADVGLRAVTGVLRSAIPGPGPGPDPEPLTRELVRLYLAYLASVDAAEGAPRDGDGEAGDGEADDAQAGTAQAVDFFDVWG